jgi:hypothetical protein
MLNIGYNLWEDCGFEEAIYVANQLHMKTGLTREQCLYGLWK